MKRLTQWNKKHELIVREEERLLNANGRISHDEMYKIMRHLAEKLAEYEDLEEQGLLIRFPCKAGDTVYEIDDYGRRENWHIDEFVVDKFVIRNYKLPRIEIYFKNTYGFLLDGMFGETVFLTREEAEAKLAELKSK